MHMGEDSVRGSDRRGPPSWVLAFLQYFWEYIFFSIFAVFFEIYILGDWDVGRFYILDVQY